TRSRGRGPACEATPCGSSARAGGPATRTSRPARCWPPWMARRRSPPSAGPSWWTASSATASRSPPPRTSCRPATSWSARPDPPHLRPSRQSEEPRVIVGCVTEIKTEEYRVGLTPESVTALVEAGHTVLIERGAGNGSHYFDEDYAAAGA